MMTYPALGYDPAPGDLGAVHRTAAQLAAVAEDAEAVAGRLRRLDGGTGAWTGPAAAEFRRLLGAVGPDIARLTCAHREAQQALRGYANCLSSAQDTARRAERDAAAGLADRDRSRVAADGAATEARSHDATVRDCRWRLAQSAATRPAGLLDPAYGAELDRYETQVRGIRYRAEAGAAQARGRENTERAAESTAEARVQASRTLAGQAKQLRDDGARLAVERLDAAAPPGRSWRQRVGGAFKAVNEKIGEITAHPEFAAWMQRLSDVGGLLLNLGSIVALVPGLQGFGVGLMAAGVAFKGLSLAGTLIAAKHGNASDEDVLFRASDLVLSVVSARGGAAAGGTIKRAVHYWNAGKVTKVGTSPWAKIVPAGQLGNAEEKLARTLHIRPKHYFQISTTVSTGTGAANAGIGAQGNIENLLDPAPQRPGWSDLHIPTAGVGINNAADKLAYPVVTGAAWGATELGLNGRQVLQR